MMNGERFSNKDSDISSEITEIGCMCTKCNCKTIIPIAVSICDDCLKDEHSSKIEYNPFDMKKTPAMKNSEKIWKLEYWIPATNQEPDEQDKVNEVDEIQD